MNKTLIAITLGAALSISIAGQSQKTATDTAPAQTKAKSVKQDSQTSSTNKAETPIISAGTALQGQLQSIVDVRKGQVGDQVVLKTTKAIKQNGEVIVPKGAKVLGRITEIQRRTKDNAVSRVGMVFDRIQGKEFEEPISLSIVSVVSATANAAAGDVFNSDISGSGSSRTTASGSGGGLLGSVAPAVGGVVSGATQTVGNVANGATQTLGRTTSSIGNTVGGLSVTQSASGSASSSSTISAQGKDVRIDKGATFNLMVNGSTQPQE